MRESVDFLCKCCPNSQLSNRTKKNLFSLVQLQFCFVCCKVSSSPSSSKNQLLCTAASLSPLVGSRITRVEKESEKRERRKVCVLSQNETRFENRTPSARIWKRLTKWKKRKVRFPLERGFTRLERSRSQRKKSENFVCVCTLLSLCSCANRIL